MKELPRGYYAVQADFENCPDKTVFCFKGVLYRVKEGENLFPDLLSASLKACETPEESLENLPPLPFQTPVILLSAGEHVAKSVSFTRSVTLLGNNAGVDPNLPASDPASFPGFNPARKENESVLKGTYDYHRYSLSTPEIRFFAVDGITLKWAVFSDRRKSGGVSQLRFSNLIYEGQNGFDHFEFCETDEADPAVRYLTLENVRMDAYDDLGYGASFLHPYVRKTVLKNVAVRNTHLLFGFSGILNNLDLCDPNLEGSEIEMENCSVCDVPEGSLSFYCGTRGKNFRFHAENCSFVNVGTPGKAALCFDTRNENASYSLKGCTFLNRRDFTPRLMSFYGEKKNVSFESNRVSGYEEAPGFEVLPPESAPETIRIGIFATPADDPHRAWIPDEMELAPLDSFYAGRKAYYGDLHVHTSCGGTSDGKLPMADWPSRMDEKNVDFAVVVDHRQMRGYFLPEWDPKRFVMGTEPGTKLLDPIDETCSRTNFHYNMLFPHRYALAMVLANFPEFQFAGTELTGSFHYPRFTRERFRELTEYVRSIGGMMVHAHPKVLMSSKEPLDYYFAERMYLETIYVTPYCSYSVKDYELWTSLLAMGKHVLASGGSDTHRDVSNLAVSTFYTQEQSGSAFFDQMRSGDFTVGYFGMQMLVGSKPMGSESSCAPGETLLLRVADPFRELVKDGTVYELRVYSDRGLAFSAVFEGKRPQAVALETQKRRFYRAEVVDLTFGARVAIGNPVWLDRE